MSELITNRREEDENFLKRQQLLKIYLSKNVTLSGIVMLLINELEKRVEAINLWDK